MSLVENLKTRATAKAPSPAEIQSEVRLAQSALADLEAQHGAVALDALSKMPGADATLRDLEQKLAAQRQRVQTLTAAHKAATEREEAAILAQRASLQKTQRAACLKHLQARDAAAAALSKAIAEAAEHYHALLDRSAKAQAACPVLTSWPDGGLCGLADLRRLVTGEMYRASASNSRDDRALPGAHHPSAETEWNPQGIAPLADQVKAASAFLASRLKGGAE